MSRENIKFSIVTVCLNAESTIIKTMRSVRKQSYANYEYIIWDGKSQDRTLELIMQEQWGDNLTIVSEPDDGLYHAMNKAIVRCTGDFVLFLNSGDMLADRNVLSDIADYIFKDRSNADVYFGNVVRMMADREVLEAYRGKDIAFRLLLAGRMPSHQSMFTRVELMKEYYFDERYTITADYNFLMKCRKYGKKLQYIDRKISRVDCVDGISSRADNLEEMRKQDDRSMRELYPIWYFILKPAKAVVRRYKHI